MFVIGYALMSVHNKGKTQVFSAAVCALLLAGCAGMNFDRGNFQTDESGYVSNPEAERLGSSAAQQLREVLAQRHRKHVYLLALEKGYSIQKHGY